VPSPEKRAPRAAKREFNGSRMKGGLERAERTIGGNLVFPVNNEKRKVKRKWGRAISTTHEKGGGVREEVNDKGMRGGGRV